MMFCGMLVLVCDESDSMFVGFGKCGFVVWVCVVGDVSVSVMGMVVVRVSDSVSVDFLVIVGFFV